MERILLYLDTNIIFDFFINEARVFRNKNEPNIPKKFEFMIEKSNEINFITSEITKTEIVRELVSSYAMTKEDIEPVWNRFLNALECEMIKSVVVDYRITDLAYKFRMRLRTMFNLIHVFAAMNNNACFISGDYRIIELIRQNKIYSNVLTYKELRQKFN